MADDKRGPREKAYDEKIAPLMTQIIAACQEAQIPMVCAFELDRSEEHDEDDPLLCSTILTGGPFVVRSPKIKQASDLLSPSKPYFAVVVTTEGEGPNRKTKIQKLN